MEWFAQPRPDQLRQPTQGADTQALATGGGGSGVQGGGPTDGGGFGWSAGGGGGSPKKGVSDGFGRPPTGGLGGRGGQCWSPPSPDPRHPKIAALMNPYLKLNNGKILLLSILDAGKIRLEDLPGVNKFKNPTTGCNTMC